MRMQKISTLIKIIPALVFLPGVAFASANFSQLNSIFQGITTFINTILVPLVFALAFLLFIWGLFVTFILGGSDEGKQTEGKQLMLYAILAFVLMVCVWGIVNLVGTTFGLSGTQTITMPAPPTATP